MATNQSNLVRKVFKKTLVPLIEEEGFQGKFPEFQRRGKGELHLLSVSFDKNGGGFFLEFARHPAGDLELIGGMWSRSENLRWPTLRLMAEPGFSIGGIQTA